MHVQTYGVFKCTQSHTTRTDLLPSIDALRRKCWCKQRLPETADSSSQRPRNWASSTNLGQCTLNLAEQNGNETSFRLLGPYWDESFNTKSNGMRFQTVLSLSKWTP